MESGEINDILLAYKALSDETRLKIVRTVAFKGQCDTNACSKGVDLSQPTLSHHLKILIEAKILLLEKIGTCNKYLLNSEYLTKLGIEIK
jgi:ArsR family transcriptional regulator, arsenate/arsenite/antimonite-responsive transcriptional repressor